MKEKSAAIILIFILMLSSVSAFAHAGGVGAGEVIKTDKSLYVYDEPIKVTVHGENYTWYSIYLDDISYDSVYTNGTGYAKLVYYAGTSYLMAGVHVLKLEKNGNVLSTVTFTVKKGLQLWPSRYTNSYTYMNGEKLWVKLSAGANRNYTVNITTQGGVQAYPEDGKELYVHTNGDGVAVFNITLKIGDGLYFLNLGNGTARIQRKSFSVESVEVVASIDKGSYGTYLLSEKLKVYVSVYWMLNHTPIKNAQYKYWIVDAYNSSLTFGPYISTKSEFYTYSLNSYSTQDGKKIVKGELYYLKVVYESGSGTNKHEAEKKVPFYTGSLEGSVYINPIDNSLSPGKRVEIDMSSYTSSPSGADYSPVPMAKIDYINITITDYWSIQWSKNWTGYGTTDVVGHARLIWTVPDVPVGSLMKVTVKYTAGNETYTAQDTRTISGLVWLDVQLDRDSYISGDTMKITLSTRQPSNVKVDGFDVWIYSTLGGSKVGLLYYTYTSTDTLTYTLPMNQTGGVFVEAKAHFSTGDVAYSSASASVSWGRIYLDASEETYTHAGEEVVIYSHLESKIMHPNLIHFFITDSKGKVIEDKNASEGEFLFTIPSMSSSRYTIHAEAIYRNMRVYGTLNLYRYTGYLVSVHLVTPSRYQNIVYQPGQKITISYSIEKVGTFDSYMPVIHWRILDTQYQGVELLKPGALNGTFTITVPSGLRGGYILEVWVSDLSDTNSNFGLLSINVGSGSWSMQDVAGMPLLSFINLVLVIVAIIIGVIAIMRQRRGGHGGEGEEPEEEEVQPEEHAEPKKEHRSLFGGKKKKGPPKPFEPPAEEPEEPSLPHEEDEIGEI